MDYLYILREALIWTITIFWLYQLLVSLCSINSIMTNDINRNGINFRESIKVSNKISNI